MYGWNLLCVVVCMCGFVMCGFFVGFVMYGHVYVSFSNVWMCVLVGSVMCGYVKVWVCNVSVCSCVLVWVL